MSAPVLINVQFVVLILFSEGASTKVKKMCICMMILLIIVIVIIMLRSKH